MVIKLTQDALSTHLYCVGASGTGKSRFLLSLMLQHIGQGVGVICIDPHGELIAYVLAYLAERRKHIGQRVILIDPLHPTHTVGFNPLELKPGEIADRKVLFLSSVISKLFQVDEMIAARMMRLLYHAFLLLIRTKLTLLEFVPLLTDRDFRSRLIETLAPTDPLFTYWVHEFPTQDRLITEWTQSSLNKVGPLVTDPDFALILGQQASTIDFRAIIDEGKVLLVNLPKGILGESTSYLMGAFILAQIQLAALSRADNPYARYQQCVLVIDEFQNFVTDDISIILAESRKYRLSLIMAHQYYEQLREQPKLQAAVLNTVGNLVVFQIGATDAELLVKDLFTPPLDQIKERRERATMTGIKWWPLISQHEIIWRPLPEIWEQEARRITTLHKREFWYKRRGNYAPVKLRTLNMPDIERTPRLEQAIAELVMQSMARYGRDKQEVARLISQRRINFSTKPDLTADTDH